MNDDTSIENDDTSLENDDTQAGLRANSTMRVGDDNKSGWRKVDFMEKNDTQPHLGSHFH